VDCVRGAAFDVMVCVRAAAVTTGRRHVEMLRAKDCTPVYVAAGIAHEFQGLVDVTEAHDWMSNYRYPDYETGLRFDDPAIAIEWPLEATHIASRYLECPSSRM
jgi:dTDP-4-dehydrorhamnose 3,5-epimerase